MHLPLNIKIYLTLRRAVKALTPEGKTALASFLQSQKRQEGYCGPGGQVEPYYTQFGKLIESALAGHLFPRMSPLAVAFEENSEENDNSIYHIFFRFLNDEMRLRRPAGERIKDGLAQFRTPSGGYVHSTNRPEAATNATCAALTMLKQTGLQDEQSLQWLMDRQDETGGFRATADAPIPDILSTGVAMFTLHLYNREPKVGVTDFVLAHTLPTGGIAPTIFDEYSDVEYIFYGLLALGSR